MSKQFNQLSGILILSLFLGLFRYFLLEEEYPLLENKIDEQLIVVESDSLASAKDLLAISILLSIDKVFLVKFDKESKDFIFPE